MPRRNPKTGKELSGAEKQREKKSAEREQDDGKWAAEFLEAGDPDLANPDTDLDYIRKLQLVVTRQMARTPFPTSAQIETWKRIKEMSAVIGLTSNKAKLEAKIRKLEGLFAQQRQAGAVRWEPGASIKKPPTARGGARGPRPLPDGLLLDPPSDEPNTE